MKKISYLTIVIFVLTASIIGCGKKEPQITGKWVLGDEEGYIDLYSDGTGVVVDTNKESDTYLESVSITWIAENDRLKLTADFGMLGTSSLSYSYKLTEDELILTSDDGTVDTYIRN